MDNPSLFDTLFRKYLDNRCSPDEVDQLMDLLKEDAYKQYAGELIELQAAASMDNHRPVDSALRERLELRLQAILGAEAPAIPVQRVHFLRRYRRWAAAAVFILLIGTGAYIWLNRSREAVLVQVKPESQIKNEKQDVIPGGNKAMLTLANGTTIVLDSAANGQLALQGKTTVIKSNDGQIAYAASNSPSTGGGRGEALYNTLSTPRGGQYKLVLPDGSIVWLNAASSIRYPTAFAGNERRVEITGEAYFEVEQLRNASGQKIPFAVDILPSTSGVGGGRIEVLGTHFNINAYNDEPATKITLLEGSIKVSGKKGNVVIKPGQQARLTNQSSILKVSDDADVEEVMAWKNGAFQFGGADIETVMRQISRWYDVEVEYKGNISLHFAGTMSRNVNISQVLDMLEKAGGLKTAVTGRKITVMP